MRNPQYGYQDRQMFILATVNQNNSLRDEVMTDSEYDPESPCDSKCECHYNETKTSIILKDLILPISSPSTSIVPNDQNSLNV